MTDARTDDTPRLIAKEPVHCHNCYRFICPSQTYFLTIENTILCPDCIRAADGNRRAVA